MVNLFKKRNWTKWDNLYIERNLDTVFLVQKREDLNTGEIKVKRRRLGKVCSWEQKKLEEIKDKFGL